MKSANLCLRFALAVLFCLSSFAVLNPASAAPRGNRCKDRCNEIFHRRKDECKSLRRWERRRCEQRAKNDRDECRRHCR